MNLISKNKAKFNNFNSLVIERKWAIIYSIISIITLGSLLISSLAVNRYNNLSEEEEVDKVGSVLQVDTETPETAKIKGVIRDFDKSATINRNVVIANTLLAGDTDFRFLDSQASRRSINNGLNTSDDLNFNRFSAKRDCISRELDKKGLPKPTPDFLPIVNPTSVERLGGAARRIEWEGNRSADAWQYRYRSSEVGSNWGEWQSMSRGTTQSYIISYVGPNESYEFQVRGVVLKDWRCNYAPYCIQNWYRDRDDAIEYIQDEEDGTRLPLGATEACRNTKATGSYEHVLELERTGEGTYVYDSAEDGVEKTTTDRRGRQRALDGTLVREDMEPPRYFLPLEEIDEWVASIGSISEAERIQKSFYFTSHYSTKFIYQPPDEDGDGGQTFTFVGDDDLWVFVNGQLVIDLGGLNSGARSSISFNHKIPITQTPAKSGDTENINVGFEPGRAYEIDIFHAERQFSGSKFRLEIGIPVDEDEAKCNSIGVYSGDAVSFIRVLDRPTDFTVFFKTNQGQNFEADVYFLDSDGNPFLDSDGDPVSDKYERYSASSAGGTTGHKKIGLKRDSNIYGIQVEVVSGTVSYQVEKSDTESCSPRCNGQLLKATPGANLEAGLSNQTFYYSSPVYSNDIEFKVDLRSDDLNYQVAIYDEDGNSVSPSTESSPSSSSENDKYHEDTNTAIENRDIKGIGRQVALWVTEGGIPPSDTNYDIFTVTGRYVKVINTNGEIDTEDATHLCKIVTGVNGPVYAKDGIHLNLSLPTIDVDFSDLLSSKFKYSYKVGSSLVNLRHLTSELFLSQNLNSDSDTRACTDSRYKYSLKGNVTCGYKDLGVPVNEDGDFIDLYNFFQNEVTKKSLTLNDGIIFLDENDYDSSRTQSGTTTLIDGDKLGPTTVEAGKFYVNDFKNLTLSDGRIACEGVNIVFVEETLTFDNEVVSAAEGDPDENACLFIVGGNVVVTDNTSTCDIQALIITDGEFRSKRSNHRLILDGGLIAGSINLESKRAADLDPNSWQSNTPTHTFVNNPKYMYLYKELLSFKAFSIREEGFLNQNNF